MPSEFELIARWFERPARGAALGVGDDCALMRVAPGMALAVSTDMLVEGRHFTTGTDPFRLGHKSLAVNLSDMAAMGATPRWATLGLALPEADETWLAGFSAGFFALAERFGVDLVGGDTTRGPRNICVTIMGEVPAGVALYRSGALPGDDIWVSGELGGAALGLALRFGRVAPEAVDAGDAAAALLRLDMPEARVALGERLRGVAHAAIDVSDGFAGDLAHILDRSAVGAQVYYDRLPRPAALARLGARPQTRDLERGCVLSGGDDYELLFTAAQARRPQIDALAAELGLALSRVGSIQPAPAAGGPRLVLLDAAGRPMPPARGFDHFDCSAPR